MQIPLPLARLCFVLVGIAGAVVTPAAQGVATWPLSIALLVVAAICMMAATTCYLRWVHGWDPLSALLGASPGSMAQVMALSAEFDADVRGIAIVHVMRVLLDRARAAGRACAVRVDGRARRLDAGFGRLLVHRACDPGGGLERRGAGHAARQISRRADVRRLAGSGFFTARIWSTSRCPGGPAARPC